MSKGRLAANIAAVLVMLVVMAGVGARLWANQQRLDVPMLWNAAVGADGRVNVVVGDRLYREPVNGKGEAEMIPLLELGIRDFNGDLLALPGGEFILSAGRIESMDFEEKLRKTARATRHADDGSDYLMRCDFDTRDCTLLNGDASEDEIFRPSRAFGLSPGPGDRLLATDATAHLAHLLAPDGRILDTLDAGFEFPNEIHLREDGSAMVVDTNHHRLVHFAVTPDGFGDEVADRSILDWPGVEGLQRFPFAWARTPDGAEWVLVAGSNMGDAILVRSQGDDRRQVELPGPSDAVDFAVLPERILVVDQGTDRILAFSHDGKPLRDFGSPALTRYLADNAEKREHYSSIMSYSLGLLVAVLALGLPAGIFYLKQRYETEQDERAESIRLKQGDTPEDSVLASDPSAMLDKLSGVYRFNRRFSFIDQRESWRLMLLLSLLFGAMLVSQFMLASMSMPDFTDVMQELLEADPTTVMLPLAAVFLPPIVLLYTRLEELRIDSQGVHYSSPLPSPFNRLHPSWSIPWRQLEDVRLTWFRSAKQPNMWRLVLVDEYGEERKLVPMQWTQLGVKEPGIRLAEMTRLSEGLVRKRIHERKLFRVLATQMQRLRRQREGAG